MPKQKILASLGFWDVTPTGLTYKEPGNHYEYEIPADTLFDGELSGQRADNSWERHISGKKFAPQGSKNYRDFLKILEKAREIHADKMPIEARRIQAEMEQKRLLNATLELFGGTVSGQTRERGQA